MSRMAPERPKAKREAKRVLPFISHDCDRCGYSSMDGGPIARANYKITTPAGDLYLCKHHYEVHEPVLSEAGHGIWFLEG